MALSIIDKSDCGIIRATCMSMVKPDRAQRLVPDSTIMGPNVAFRAEFLVKRRIGTEWPLIVQGIAPVQYAGGDPVAAQWLTRSAVMMFICSFLCPILKQIIPKQEESEIIRITRDLDWTKMQAEYLSQAQMDMSLVKSLVNIVPGMLMSHPLATSIDPDAPQNYRQIRPYYHAFPFRSDGP